jgi:hypothetical protein
MSSFCQIDATAVAPLVDRELAAWTSDGLRETFLHYGCAIVRNSVSPDLIEKARAAIANAYETASGVHVYDKEIKAASGGVFNGFELVGHPTLRRFLDLVFSGQLYFRKNATARRIRGEEAKSSWQEPLALHLDAQFHRFQFTVNFWMPLQDCGIDAPSLQVVPLDYISTRNYSGYTGCMLRIGEPFRFGYFANRALDPDVVTATFGEKAFLRPIMKAGDLVVASNWLIHGSYSTPDMTRGRTSIELRFIGTDLDVAPHLSPLVKRLAYAVTGRTNQNFAEPRRS